jgi:hypothetical protein
MKQTIIRFLGIMGLTGAAFTANSQSIEWGPAGPVYTAGRIRNMLVDANDPSGQTLYAGSSSGGVFKSVNGGSQWAPVQDQGTVKNISYMAQSASTKEIFVGTGEGFAVLACTSFPATIW